MLKMRSSKSIVYIFKYVSKLMLVFYFYSLNSFDNALVFKTLDDDDIAYVQEFVRKDLLGILERYSSGHSSVSSDLKIHLFGDFVCNPEKFCFSKSELDLIKNISQHIAAIEKSQTILHTTKILNVM